MVMRMYVLYIVFMKSMDQRMEKAHLLQQGIMKSALDFKQE